MFAAVLLVAIAALGGGLRAASPLEPATNIAGVAVPGIRLLYRDAAEADLILDRTVRLGAGWLRTDGAFAELSPAPGRYDWSRLDRLVAAARARQLSVLLVLGTTPSWARPPGMEWNYGPADDAGRAAFAGFAGRAAHRYRGQVAAYEIWNEPNLPGSWAPRPDPASYLDLLSAAFTAIKHADPPAVVLSGGTGAGDDGIDAVLWYRTLYAGGLRSVTDGIAVHPYPNGTAVTTGELPKALEIRRLMDENGDAAKPLWGTETGAPTAGAHSMSEQAQAAVVPKVYDYWRAVPNHGPLFYYTLADTDGDRGDRENHFGLLRTDGSEKPGYAVLQRWIADVAPRSPTEQRRG
jgi:hypothetical protein